MYTIISSPTRVFVAASTQSEAERVGSKWDLIPDDSRTLYTWGPQISPAGLLTLLEIMLENIDLEGYTTAEPHLADIREDIWSLHQVLSNAGVEHAPPLEV